MSDTCETVRIMRGELDCIVNKSDVRKTDVIYSEKQKEQPKKKASKKPK